MLALGCNPEAGGSYNARCIRGSDLEDYTDWTTTATNNAFEHPGRRGGDHQRRPDRPLCRGLDGHRAVLGAVHWRPPVKPIASIASMAASGCSASTPIAYTTAWPTGSRRTISTAELRGRWLRSCPARSGGDFTLNYGGGSPLVYAIPRYNEIWLHYADSRDGGSTCGRFVALCLDDMSWFRGARLRSNVLSAAHFSTRIFLGSVDTGAFASASGSAIYIEGTGARDEPSYIQSADQYLESGKRRMLVRSIKPDSSSRSAMWH